MKTQILEKMKILVSDGQTIASKNENDFTEFAEVNGYDVELVKEVYEENKEELIEIWKENQ